MSDPTVPDAAGAGAGAPGPGIVLHLRGAAFGYAERPVLTGVDLDVRAGEVVAILGPNGSGKTTLVKGLLGLASTFAGQVHILGTPVDQRRGPREHGRVGYVPQRHTAAGTVRATVREVVSTGRLTRKPLWGKLTRTDRGAVTDALALVDLGDRAEVDLADLSGGQQRRALIARALAGEPELLLLDEPTAGVDIASQHVLADVLGRLAATGVTMLIVTHELAALASLVTRVVVVDSGRITFDGPSADFAERAETVLHDHGYHHHRDDTGPAADSGAARRRGPAADRPTTSTGLTVHPVREGHRG